MFTALLWLSLILPAQAAEDPKCEIHLSPQFASKIEFLKNKGFEVSIFENSITLEYTAPNGHLFTAWANLEDGEVLKMGLNTRSSQEPFRILGFYANEMFDFMIEHFSAAKYLVAEWTEDSDNLAEFNALASGNRKSLSTLAKKTWTGRQALRNGFKRVTLVDTEGRRGRYSSVVVYFKKSSK